jgi:zinc transport system substrate-binding protein
MNYRYQTKKIIIILLQRSVNVGNKNVGNKAVCSEVRFPATKRLVVFFLLSLMCTGSWANDKLLNKKPLIVASIEPLSMLAHELFADQADVETLLLSSQNPHHASFTPKQLELVHQADLVIWLGAAAEPYLVQYLSARSAHSIALLEQPGVLPLVEELPDPDDPDELPGGTDPHLWTDPLRVLTLLPALVRQGTALGLPHDLLVNRANHIQHLLEQEVADARKALKGVALAPWLSYHNPWQYLQQRLGIQPPLTVVAAPGGDTGSKHFLWLAKQMQQLQVRCTLAEPEAQLALLKRLCQGPTCHLHSLDPLGRDDAGDTYSHWWKGLVAQFHQCLATQRP